MMDLLETSRIGKGRPAGRTSFESTRLIQAQGMQSPSPDGGEIFSRFWKVPLKRELCRAPFVEPTEDVELLVCRTEPPSTVFRRPPCAL